MRAVFLDFGTGRAALSLVRVVIYATFAAVTLLGRFSREGARPARLAGLSIAASVLFFLTSNFAEWVSNPMYPKTPAGLTLCYAAAVPFFWNTLAADLAGALGGLALLLLPEIWSGRSLFWPLGLYRAPPRAICGVLASRTSEL